MKDKSLEKIQGQAETALTVTLAEQQSAERTHNLIFLLGGIDAVHVISRNLTAAMIANLQRVRDEELYRDLGFSRFDDFLDNYERSPMKYKRFNYLEGVHKTLGGTEFDLLAGSGLSYRQMKQLAAGDIVIEGKEVVIGGGDRVSLGDSRVVKDLVEKLITERAAEKAENEKLTKQVDKQKEQLERGRDEYDELRRNIDAAEQGSPYERALMAAIKAMITLTSEAEALDADEKAERAKPDLETLTSQFFQLQDAFGVKGMIRYRSIEADQKPVEEMTDEEKKATFFDRHANELSADDLSDD